MEGTDDCPYTKAQYESLAHLTKAIQLLYPAITNERITGHADISPGRKTDPGPYFDWEKYRALLEF
jgi:AmpD protein